MSKKQFKKMIKISGKVRSKSQLDCFLYFLMRDYVTPGEVERLIQDSILEEDCEDWIFCNGWLAEYAKYCAKRLEDKE